MNNQTQEIKNKLDVVDIISEYVQLKQAGTNFKGLCPFHNEKTPSFMVSREKQIWHCFGCGEGGDIYSFIQKYDNLEFPEALKILAQKAGVKLKKLDPKLVSQKTKLIDITRYAAAYFHKSLQNLQEAQIARDYLEKRMMLPKTREQFYLGYAPDSWDKLLNFLRKKGYQDNDIFLAGLVVKNDKSRIYDRFRKRLMFPIFDHNNNVVGFTGRILSSEQENQGGKYVNTPQTLIYNKSYVIYGLEKAKNEIKQKNLAVIVEGNMDVIASHQAGIKNVIASSGTALTLEQLKLLQRYTNNLALAFDVDPAGQVAAERGIDTALSLGINIKIIRLPEKINNQEIKDPDDLIKQGTQYWQKCIDQAVSFMDYYVAKTFKSYDNNSPESKKEIANKLLKQIAKLKDKVEQDHWLKVLAQKLDVSENILHEAYNEIIDKKQENNQEIKFETEKIKSRENLIAEQLIALTLKYPQNLEYVINHLQPEAISDQQIQNIYKNIILLYNNNDKFDLEQLEKNLSKEDVQLVNLLSTLLLLADKDFFDFTEEKIKQEIINNINYLKKSYLTQKIKQIENLLSQAEKNNDQQQITELTKDFSALSQELNNL